ncbi:tetratricopeptide repeat protein [Kitasatospora sp. NPDC002227]|uniref:ATP-binding protein n=1 Tax=Kitasatospora sp. NPDC002227 TaxID=3154773 RepID=UPI00331C4B2A
MPSVVLTVTGAIALTHTEQSCHALADPSEIHNPPEFLRGLRLLRVEAGNPSLRDLTRATGIPRSTLAAIFDTRRSRLPRLDSCLAVLTALGATGPQAAAWADAWKRLRGAGPPAPEQLTGERPRPAQLPRDLPDFTGRAGQLAALAARCSPGSTPPGVPVLAAVTGTGGVGKTSLAVHLGHAVRDRYPDGQLYADLRGASTGPTAPTDLLARFLVDLGLAPAAVPAGEEARAAAYRSLLADRRVLLLLDDAASAGQILPLLPGTAGCAVVVTSRNRLAGLDGADRIDLDLLEPPDARALFERFAGAAATAAEPSATEQVLKACAGLPLAVRIAAARLATEPTWTVATLAARLADRDRLLDELCLDDRAVRTTCDVSYTQLSAEDARLLRLIGLWDGPDLSIDAVAALLGRSRQTAERSLAALSHQHLLQSVTPGRYRPHDLIRAYAAERAAAEEPAEERREALTRLLDWTLRSWDAATDLLAPQRQRVALPPPCHHGPLPALPDYSAALDWLEAERHHLRAAVTAAEQTEHHELCWKLAVVGCQLYNRRDLWADWETTHETALRAARAVGDDLGTAWTLNNLGALYTATARPELALRRLREALEIRRRTGDGRAEALTLTTIGTALHNSGDQAQAVELHSLAAAVAHRLGDRYAEGIALSNLGETLCRLGWFGEAAECQQQALAIHRAIGDRYGEAFSLDLLGEVARENGRFAEALDLYGRSLAMRRELGNAHGEGLVERNIGLTWSTLGDPVRAAHHWGAALQIFERLGAPEAVTVRRQLAALA